MYAAETVNRNGGRRVTFLGGLKGCFGNEGPSRSGFHAHAIGWAAVLLGVASLCGATRSAWNGHMDLDNPHVPRSTVRFTAAADPGPFASYLLLFYGAGIAAVLFGVYRVWD